MEDLLALGPYGSGIPDSPMATTVLQNASCFPNLKKQVQKFWQRNPCDSWFTDELPGTSAFYRTLDEHRYRVHPKLLATVDFKSTRGLRVLEIGCGCGSEAERFARAGAHYTAVDLTNAAVSITRRRFWRVYKVPSREETQKTCPSPTVPSTSYTLMASFITPPTPAGLCAKFTACFPLAAEPSSCFIAAVRLIMKSI